MLLDVIFFVTSLTMLSIKVLDEGVIGAGVFTVGKKEFEQMVPTCFTIFFTI